MERAILTPEARSPSDGIFPRLQLRSIRKIFPGVVALDDVSFDLRAGEVHVLLGENGAGKSTLMKIISGAYPMTSGELILEGEAIEIRNPRHAQELGIGIIYQEFNLVPKLSAGRNIFLGREPHGQFGLIDDGRIHVEAKRILERLGISIDPWRHVDELGVAEMQMVEIAKALSLEARILIMDEPTSALTDREIAQLFSTIRKLRDDGVSIIYISHRLEELFEIGDRVTVLRDGKWVATHDVKNVTQARLIREMVDREIRDHYPRIKSRVGEEVLRVEDLHSGDRVQGVSFSLRSGEILGIAGLMGSGRTELARAIFGANHVDHGRIYLHGELCRNSSPRSAIRSGLGLLTEDRKGEGLVLQLSVGDNVSLPNLRHLSRWGFLLARRERSSIQTATRGLRIKTPSLDQPVVFLSGGNQQKVVLGKWLGMKCRILIFDEPTRGIDVGAKMEIYQLMNELTEQGAAILMISSDLPEVIGMSDRILVMSAGRIVGELDRAEASQSKVMELALKGARAGV